MQLIQKPVEFAEGRLVRLTLHEVPRQENRFEGTELDFIGEFSFEGAVSIHGAKVVFSVKMQEGAPVATVREAPGAPKIPEGIREFIVKETEKALHGLVASFLKEVRAKRPLRTATLPPTVM